jgi:integrase
MRLRSTGTEDRAEAELFFGRWLLDRGITSGPDPTVAEILGIYGSQHAPRTAAPARIAIAVTRLNEWWGDCIVSAVTAAACERYVRHRSRAVSIGTVRRELGVLQAALRHCVASGVIPVAPPVKLPRSPPGRDRWLSRDEVARLLWEARRDTRARLHLPLFILIALYTGARRSAILGLTWSQVDLEQDRIDFNEPGRPRTNKRRAIIPIPRRLRTFLVLARDRSHTDRVFHVTNIGRSFTTAARRAGLPALTMHVLRHTVGTWLAQAGVPLWEVAGWLGHTMARTTELYAHHHPDHFAAARRALDTRTQTRTQISGGTRG